MRLTKLNFFEGIEVLEQNGRRDLAGVCWHFYQQMVNGCPTTRETGEIGEFLNYVFSEALLRPQAIPAADILLSPDFTFLRSMAQVMLELDLVAGDIYEITDEELEEC